jgi:hypothetical protein
MLCMILYFSISLIYHSVSVSTYYQHHNISITRYTMKTAFALGTLALAATSVAARDIPDNVKSLYDSLKSGSCSEELQGGFYSEQDDSKDFSYCQHTTSTGAKIVYLHGKSNGGEYVNMDIDCDGDQSNPGDGRCGSSDDTQSQTAFQDTVQSYGIKDLNANIHPYVVFGNEGSADGYVNFDPRSAGIEPLSLMAVVCGDKLVYGVWGDTNGDDGPPIVGEASLSLATACFGTDMNGNNGHGENDVLYIAFPGQDAVPGEDANWAAGSYDDFEASIQDFGDSLVANL